MATTCKRLMVRKHVHYRRLVQGRIYDTYSYNRSYPARAADIKRHAIAKGTSSEAIVLVGPGEAGLHLCDGQIVADVRLYEGGHTDAASLEIEYRCERCKLPADKHSVGIGHWPDDQYELETWLNQLLKDR